MKTCYSFGFVFHRCFLLFTLIKIFTIKICSTYPEKNERRKRNWLALKFLKDLQLNWLQVKETELLILSISPLTMPEGYGHKPLPCIRLTPLLIYNGTTCSN